MNWAFLPSHAYLLRSVGSTNIFWLLVPNKGEERYMKIKAP